MGRGGTGKTSFVAMQAKFLLDQNDKPLLLVDVDPDQNLAEMVGVDLEKEGVQTIAELVSDTFIRKGGTMTGIAPTERIENRVLRDGLYEGNSFDLIAVGTKWIEGCYCMPDAALKGALDTLAKNYRYVLVDSPAGLEHLNRKVTASVSDIFDIMGPSHKSFAHVKRAERVAREVGITFDRFFVIGGCLFPEGLDSRVEEETGRPYLGKIVFDPLVQESVMAGKSLLDIPAGSLGYRSVCTLMEKAGYKKSQ